MQMIAMSGVAAELTPTTVEADVGAAVDANASSESAIAGTHPLGTRRFERKLPPPVDCEQAIPSDLSCQREVAPSRAAPRNHHIGFRYCTAAIGE